jgi:4-amino-4-deoxy-L-arabinose transferase-like glycosyltransferase
MGVVNLRALTLSPAPRGSAPLALGLGLLYTLWLALTSREVGIPRDESVYMYAADRVIAWWSAWWSAWGDRGGGSGGSSGLFGLFGLFGPSGLFGAEAVKVGFEFNHEHPALMKGLFALSRALLHDQLRLISDPTLAYRLPTMLLSGLMVGLTAHLAARLGGLAAGLGAGLALASMPRVFFHAHLACFDAPVTALWLLMCLAYLRAAERGTRGALISVGVTFGLGFSTKLNAAFAPFLLLAVSLAHLAHLRRAGSPLGVWVRRYALIGASGALIGFGVFWAHWPWLYHDGWGRLLWYINFHARHEHYPVDYFGELLYRPPFPIEFPVVMTLVSVPVATLALGAVGVWAGARGAWARWRARGEGAGGYPIELLLLANLTFPIALIALPSTPIFGGTKHWMPAMPFLCVFAGIAFARLTAALSELLPRHTPPVHAPLRALVRAPLCALVCALVMFTPSLLATARSGAHGPAWYNELVGGAPGAAERRLPRNFWGYSTVGALPQLNEGAERGAEVFWHDATGAAIHRYRLDRRLRADVGSTGDWTYPYAAWAVYHDQRDKRAEEIDLWWAYGEHLPVGGLFVDGVQLIGVYRAP